MTFLGVMLRKKTGNVDPKMVPKIWTPFWGPRKEKTIRRTPKRGPDFAPHFRVHIAHYFSWSDAGKIDILNRMLVSRFVVVIATCPGTGEDLAEGASFWHAFLTPFWGPETIVMFKRNYVEAMFRLSQIQDKPSKSFDQNQPDITFVKKLVQSTNVFEAKGYMTKPKQKNKWKT